MITDLSDLVRLESNKIALNKFLFPVGDFFYELEIFFTPSISDKNISISSKVEPETLLITADFYRLKQVFMNLIGNAIKLGDGIQVKLLAHEDPTGVVFIVEDNGPGIPKDKLPFIFEKYSRLHNYKNNADGLGLGLSIVKSIVGLHNGSITVESEIGKGTRFIITLPKV
jgi:signal transduction histidine kinase